MPRARCAGAGRAAGDPETGGAREVHLGGDRAAARTARAVRGRARVRLVRGQPRPGDPARLGEGAEGARRHCARRCRAPSSLALPGLGGGPARQRLRRLPAGVAREPGAAAALHRLLRGGLRRALRRGARRLRARDDDCRGADAVRVREGAPGAAGQAGRRRRAAVGEPPRARSRSSSRSSSSSRSRADSASTTRPGGSTRPCIRSRAGRDRRTSGSRRATSRRTSTGCSRPCTRPGTASTSTRSTRRSNAHRSGPAPRSVCTSRRAGCGRTSSVARCRLAASSSRDCRSSSPTRSRATTPSAGTARSTK